MAPEAVVAKLRAILPASEFKFGTYDRDTQADEYIAQLAALGITDRKEIEAAAAAAKAAAAADE